MLSARPLAYLLTLLLVLVAVVGCGYRFTADTGTRLAAGQSVWVPYFKNTTVHTTAAVALRRSVYEQFAAQRSIKPAAGPKQADLQLDGTVTGYAVAAVSYSAGDAVKEYRVTITADIQMQHRDAVTGSKPVWRGILTAWHDYPASTAIELQRSSEDAAVAAACRKLAQQLIWQVEQQY